MKRTERLIHQLQRVSYCCSEGTKEPGWGTLGIFFHLYHLSKEMLLYKCSSQSFRTSVHMRAGSSIYVLFQRHLYEFHYKFFFFYRTQRNQMWQKYLTSHIALVKCLHFTGKAVALYRQLCAFINSWASINLFLSIIFAKKVNTHALSKWTIVCFWEEKKKKLFPLSTSYKINYIFLWMMATVTVCFFILYFFFNGLKTTVFWAKPNTHIPLVYLAVMWPK